MRFKTTGSIATEDVVTVAQRLVALLQDAGVTRISGLNAYLTPQDAKGSPQTLGCDGNETESVTIDIQDLRVDASPAPLEIIKQAHSPFRNSQSKATAKRRRTS